MRIVLDTNVIISALLFDGVPEKVVIRSIGGENTLVILPYIIEETSRILQSKFKIPKTRLILVERFLSQADVQYFQPFLRILTDEPDNRIIETAVCGKADVIVTGDRLLLELEEYKGIRIVKPADFLQS